MSWYTVFLAVILYFIPCFVRITKLNLCNDIGGVWASFLKRFLFCFITSHLTNEMRFRWLLNISIGYQRIFKLESNFLILRILLLFVHKHTFWYKIWPHPKLHNAFKSNRQYVYLHLYIVPILIHSGLYLLSAVSPFPFITFARNGFIAHCSSFYT